MREIALFDFDGTITTKDTFIEFTKYSVGDIKFFLGVLYLSPMLIAFKLKLIPNYKAKEYMLSYFFKGIEEDKFKELATNYSLNKIDNIVRKRALQEIKQHKKNGVKVVIVSASIECWLKPWCKRENLELISTKLEFINGKFSGRLLTKNCYGIEKVNRIKEQYNLKEFKTIYGYGDSSGDKDMLSISTKSYYKPFRD